MPVYPNTKGNHIVQSTLVISESKGAALKGHNISFYNSGSGGGNNRQKASLWKQGTHNGIEKWESRFY